MNPSKSNPESSTVVLVLIPLPIRAVSDVDSVLVRLAIFATLPNFLSINAFRLQSSGDPADEVKWKRMDKISRIFGPAVYVMLVLIIVFLNAKGNPNTAAFLSLLQ